MGMSEAEKDSNPGRDINRRHCLGKTTSILFTSITEILLMRLKALREVAAQ